MNIIVGANPVIDEIFVKSLSLFSPPPDISIVEWAESNRSLSKENSAMPGKYRVCVTEYMREMLNCANDRKVEKVVCMKSAQVAWTDGFINNVLGYYIDQDPSPILIMFPKEKAAEKYSKGKFSPMVRDTPALKEKIHQSRLKSTLLSKTFDGGHLEMVGSNAPDNMSAEPIRIIMVEEPDRCASSAGREGNSLKLAYERGKTFFNRKIFLGGSPTIKGKSDIHKEFLLSDQRYYYIPCPYCGYMQTLEWEMVKWEKNANNEHPVYGHHQPETAKLKCKHCGDLFDNTQKNKAVRNGEWRAHEKFNGIAGFFINEFYSPFPKATLSDTVKKFLEAENDVKQGDYTTMIPWVNTTKGLPFEIVGKAPKQSRVMSLMEDFNKNSVIDGIRFITVGVDLGGSLSHYSVHGWGIDREMWVIESGGIAGSPNDSKFWKKIDHIREDQYCGFPVKCMIIDTGYLKDTVYDYCDKHKSTVRPCKGRALLDKYFYSSEIMAKNRRVKLWHVSTGTFKGWLHGRINSDDPETKIHISKSCGSEYCEHIISESYDDNSGLWIKNGKNHMLDTTVYASAAAMMMGVQRLKSSKQPIINRDHKESKVSSNINKRGRKIGWFDRYK